MSNNYSIKIALAGGQAVGKSSLISRLISNIFSYKYNLTIGVKTKIKELTVDKNKIKLFVYDVGGHPKLKGMKCKMFKESLEGLILVYDLMRPDTLDSLNYWIRVNKEDNENHEKCQIMLAGNKLDLYAENEVMEESLNGFLEENKEIKTHYKMSAKTGENVKKAFRELISLIVDNK